MESTYTVGPDITVLPAHLPVPGLGLLPINAFVIKGREPVLVDAGAAIFRDDFLSQLRTVIDPRELRWLYLTHTDQDHIGGIHTLLEESPQLRVITTFLGVGKMGLFAPLPMDRVYLLNPGQSLDIGDRTLHALRPPVFDAPETTALFDARTRTLFSSDSFGGVLQAPAQDAHDIPEADLQEGQLLWATVDAPWLANIDRSAMHRALGEIRELQPETILSSHLPAAVGMTDQLLRTLAGAPDATPFTGPDQAALEAMLAQMTQGAPA